VQQVATLYYILLSSRKTTITPYLVLEPELEVVREEPPEYEPDLEEPPEYEPTDERLVEPLVERTDELDELERVGLTLDERLTVLVERDGLTLEERFTVLVERVGELVVRTVVVVIVVVAFG
jgi:hypothetical protein